MTKILLHDFIEVEYTGKFLNDTIFDTTDEAIAKQNHIFSPQMKYKPAIVCIGEQQLIPGLDSALINKEVGKTYTINIQPEEAFGKKDIKKIRLIPIAEFQKQKIAPQPGLQINVDGEVGTVIRASGGRIMVNFNHPFAGREVVYEIKINKKITDQAVQINSYLELSLNMPNLKTEIKENKAIILLPMDLPEPIQKTLADKLKELTKLKEIKFKAEKKTSPN